MEQGQITEADTPTIRLGATPFGLVSDPLQHPPFYAGCPSCGNPPNLFCLGIGTKYAGLHTQWCGCGYEISRPQFFTVVDLGLVK